MCISSVNLTNFFNSWKKIKLPNFIISLFFSIKTPDFHKAGRRKINLKKINIF